MKHRSKRLLDRVRDAIRLKGYSVRTEEAYVEWITRFILFHDKRHPQEMGYPDVRAFLLHLATEENDAPPDRFDFYPVIMHHRPRLSMPASYKRLLRSLPIFGQGGPLAEMAHGNPAEKLNESGHSSRERLLVSRMLPRS